MIDSWQSLKMKNKRGLFLSALLREAGPQEKTRSAPHNDSALVIVCHGFTGSKEGGGQAAAMGEKLATLGYSTLLFDFSGCGQSEGHWQDLTLSGQIDDLEEVVKWSRFTGYRRIILNGRSFGGSTVIGYAARDKTINAVCTWAAVASLEKVFSRYLNGNTKGPLDEIINIEAENGCLELKRMFFDDLAKHNLLEYAAAISPASLLVIHGSEDDSVHYNDAEILYNAAGEPKKLVIIAGADHRFSEHTSRVWEEFFSWLKDLP